MPPISEVWRYVTQRDDRTLECTMCGWQLAHPYSAAVLRLHLQHHHRIHFTAETGRGEPQGTDSTGDETQCEEEQGHSDTLDIDSPEPHTSPGSSRCMTEMLRECAAQLEDEEEEGPGDGDPHPTLTEDELSTLLRSCGPGRGPRGGAELTSKRRLEGGSPDRAETWDFFKKLNERCVECSLCRKQLCFHASTASLREHLRRKHRLGEAQPRQGADDGSSGSESVGREPEVKRNRAVGERGGNAECPECPERRRDALDRLLLGLVYRDLQPLGLGKQAGFRRLLGYLEPSYRPPTAAHLSAALRSLYLRARQHLAAQLSSVPALALSTHSWSGRGGRPFVTVLAHYTDARWATVRCALRTGRAPGPDLLLSALADYQLPAAAVSCVVEDSPRARAEWPPYSLPCARRALDLCLRQTLRLDALKPALGAARRLAAHLQLGPDTGHSGHGPEQLDIGLLPAGQWPEPLDTGLPPAGQWPEADTGPHWDNTLQMCERLLRLRPALDGEPALSPQHWQVLRDLVSVLRPLRLGLAFLAEPHNASVSALLPCVHGVAAALAQCPLEAASPARAAGARLRHLLLRRWELESGPDVAAGPAGPAAVASFLDPRFKDLRFLDARTRDHIHRKVRALLAATPPETRPASPCPPPLGPSPGPASPGPPTPALPSDYDLLFGTEPAGALPESRLQLDGYLSEPLRKRDSDPFHWWRDNGHRFPALARLARRYLSIPAAAGPISLRPNSPPAGGTDADVEHIVFLHTNTPYIDLLQ